MQIGDLRVITAEGFCYQVQECVDDLDQLRRNLSWLTLPRIYPCVTEAISFIDDKVALKKAAKAALELEQGFKVVHYRSLQEL